MTRAEAATKLCERLTSEVELIAPDGIGRWEPAWQIVAPADSDFMIALTRWEVTAAEEDRDKVRRAYEAVLDAWKDAARQYQELVT